MYMYVCIHIYIYMYMLDCFTQQSIVELDQGTLAAVRERLGTWVMQLDEEHLWRLDNHTLPFALHRHITLAQPRFISPCA